MTPGPTPLVPAPPWDPDTGPRKANQVCWHKPLITGFTAVLGITHGAACLSLLLLHILRGVNNALPSSWGTRCNSRDRSLLRGVLCHQLKRPLRT